MVFSFSFRFWVAVLSGLFGLTAGAPITQAACLSAASGMAGSCGESAPTEVCDWSDGGSSAVCSSHHASQEALTSVFPSPDTEGGSRDSVEAEGVVPSVPTTVAALSFGAVIPRVYRRHVHVGVWLE